MNENIETLDLRGVKCPMNYVKAKLALEKLPKGTKLKTIIDLGEPVEMVPKSLKADGYEILEEKVLENSCELLIENII